MRVYVVALALVGVTVLASSASATTVLFDNWNLDTVYNPAYGPNSDGEIFSVVTPKFTISDSYLITFVDTYHWNDGYGMPGFVGELALHSLSDDTVYGWWQATGAPGMNGCENAVWIAEPNVVIPPGTYEVLDYVHQTWSYNEASFGVSFSEVRGTLADAVPEPLTLVGVMTGLLGLGKYLRKRLRA